MAPILDLVSWRVVTAFRRRFFDVIAEYRRLCSNGSLELSISHHFILRFPVSETGELYTPFDEYDNENETSTRTTA